LDQLGTEIFTTGKVRKALDHIFAEAPASFVRLIRKTMSDPSVTPSQIEEALCRIWDTGKQMPPATPGGTDPQKQTRRPSERPSAEYSETHHTAGKPSEVVELYRALDKFCQDLAPMPVS
jgi:hypothetical protein